MKFYTCPVCHMNRRQYGPGPCRFCIRTVMLHLEKKEHVLNLIESAEQRIKTKAIAGQTLTPIEYAIARVRMREDHDRKAPPDIQSVA